MHHEQIHRLSTTKILTPADTSRGSTSPTPKSTKGSQRKSRAPRKRTSKRNAPAQKEEPEAPEVVTLNSSSLVENQTAANSSLDKPPIVLKLTLKKAEKPSKREKRSSSEKTPKERTKKTKKLSLSVVLPSSPQANETNQNLENDTTMDTNSSSSQPSIEEVREVEASPKKSAGDSKADTSFEITVQSPPRPVLPMPVRRRAQHLLPGKISTDGSITPQVLNNMLHELEIKYYGDEERHSYTQEQFNDAILSGNYMRVRKAMVSNVLTAPRLATWTNPLGVNLLHLVRLIHYMICA
ncbi:hypothetical protein KIN20_029014 [Parelaphostrongylus tenuis]|uniref:Uncharacterized protein n=1 Tax=Parelaphostrongylus tenuis TaxID=148309 RepID=A0AAD5R1Y8_PARTN|nr:hypothetical protein KIN20_029014 [Parelaphostrongylus tenuis]